MAVIDLGKVVPEKGVDYFTQEEIEQFKADIEEDIPTATSNITNDGDGNTFVTGNNGYYAKTSNTNTGINIKTGNVLQPVISGTAQDFDIMDTRQIVTEFQTTPEDTKVPSEKLVKDELDEKEAEIEALQQENAELLDQIPTGTATDKIIHLEDSSDLSFAGVQMIGEASQVQTTGKNMIDDTLYENGGINSSGEETTSNSSKKSSVYIECEPNTQYTLSFEFDIFSFALCEYDTNKTFIQRDGVSNTSSVTITTTNETRYLKWTFNYNNATNLNQDMIHFIHLQLEQGSTATEYEPYTNRETTPNPDYAQNINVVTADNFIKMNSKNLFNGADSYININGSITYSFENETVTITNSSSSQQRGIMFFIPVIVGKPITISYISKDNTSGTLNLRYKETNSKFLGTTFGGASFGENITNYVTFTTSKKYLVLVLQIGMSSTGSITGIQVEYGDTATTYEPYTEKTQLISLGAKNLFDASNVTYDDGHYRNDDGDEATSSSAGYTISYIQVKPNTTYIFSGEISDTGSMGRIYFYDNNQEWISRSLGWNAPYTFTTPENCYYIQFQYHVDQVDFNTVQLEEGEVAHSYSTYGQEPIELCKIGDYKDRIYKADGKWWLEKNIGKVILNGTEEWTSYSRNGDSALAFAGVYAPSNALPTKSYDADINPLIASNKFKRGTYSELYYKTIVNGIARFTGQSTQEENQNIFVAVDRDALASYTLTGFKSWLETNTPILYYVSNPTTTQITDTTLIGQLENWLKMHTYKNITNSFTDTENEKPTLKERYYLDLETLFNDVAVLKARVELLEE